MPPILNINGSAVFFVKNVQGDITALMTYDGYVFAKYYYDAWGNITITDANGYPIINPENPALLNPFRYRGYFYDTETGFYYCTSRYYDPNVRRFLNSDNADVLTLSEGPSADKNLFAYCDNNPVIRVDNGGQFWESVFDIVSLGFSIYDVIRNPKEVGSWAGLVGDVIDLIPFVTGVGEVVRATKITSKIADSFGNLSKAQKYGIQSYNKLKTILKKQDYLHTTL